MRRRQQFETMDAPCDLVPSLATVGDRSRQLAARLCQVVQVCHRNLLKAKLSTPAPEVGAEITARHLQLASSPVQEIRLNLSLTLADDPLDQIMGAITYQALVN